MKTSINIFLITIVLGLLSFTAAAQFKIRLKNDWIVNAPLTTINKFSDKQIVSLDHSFDQFDFRNNPQNINYLSLPINLPIATESTVCSELSFPNPPRFWHFNTPPTSNFDVADFNNDGKPDLAVTTGVLLGTGDGTFVSGGCHWIGDNGAGIKAADFNLDGNMDLAGPHGDNLVRIALGDGMGNFTNGVSTPAGNIPYSLDIGDVNGDGNPDIVVANRNSSKVSVLIGKGDGLFFPPVSYSTNNFDPKNVILEDFNRDNKLDIAVGESGGVLLGNGDGTFKPLISSGVGTFSDFADFNEDGFPDLVRGVSPSSISISIGNGNGSFQNPTFITVGTNPTGIIVADFNLDNHLDVAVTLSDEVNGVRILLGTGNGTFNPTTAFITSPRAYGLTTGDFNLDGKPDIATLNYRGGETPYRDVAVLLGDGNGGFDGSSKIYESGRIVYSLVTEDLNSDGNLDFAAVEYSTITGGRNVIVSFGNSDGSIQPAVTYSAPPNQDEDIKLKSIDLNNDGSLDLVTETCSFLNNGTGMFGSAIPHESIVQAIDVGEFTGDSYADLIGVNRGSNTFVLLKGNGDGTFTKISTLQTGNFPTSISSGDFDSDGFRDVIIGNTSSATVSIFFGSGNGTFRPKQDIPVSGLSDTNLLISDFNSDGKLDWAVVTFSNLLSIFLGNGNGSFTQRINTQLPPRAGEFFINSMTVADFDGDNIKDIGLAILFNVAIVKGNGNGSFQQPLKFISSKRNNSLSVGDFNHDGKLDIAASANQGGITILLADCPRKSTTVSVSSTPNPSSVGTPVTITATVTSNGIPVTEGSIIFRNWCNVIVGPFPVNENGEVSITVSQLVLGNNNFTAEYSGSSNFVANSTYFIQQVISCPTIDIFPSSIEEAKVGVPYSITFTQSGGSANTLLTVSGTLPPGLTFSNGVLSGTPTAAGDYSFTITANDGGSCSKSKNYLLPIRYNPPTISGLSINRTQGVSSSNSQIASVSDDADAEQNLIVRVNGSSSATVNGVTVSNIQVASNGTVTADVVADCGATDTSFTIGVTNSSNLSATAILTINVSPNSPPVLGNYPSAGIINIGTGTAITPDAAPSDNVSISSISVNANGFTGNLSVDGATGVITVNNASPAGTFTITVTATDNCGATTTREFSLVVNGAPIVSGQNITRQRGDAGMVSTIALANDDLTSAGSLAVSLGTIPSGIIIGNLTNNNGTITATVAADCSAALGNNFVLVRVIDEDSLTTAATLTINVTENPMPTVTITSPPSGAIYQIGSTVNFVGSFAENARDVHTAEWSFSSINSSFLQAGTVDEINKTITASYAFNSSGVYLVSLSVTDECGNTATATTVNNDIQAMIVVYDPNGGFVTGGGWIDSPFGAYRADTSLIGKASFGFVSKYQNGANVPTGNTEFQFRTASFNFRSTSYEWLVFAGARAQYKGSGMINGSGDYGFMLTAIDGQVSGGGGVDKFRIKIWDKSTGSIIYDNQVGDNTSDNATPNTVLGGGSIVIHKP